MPRHTPRASERRPTTKRPEPKMEFRQLSERRPAANAFRQQQWMQVTTREYFSPFACRQ